MRLLPSPQVHAADVRRTVSARSSSPRRRAAASTRRCRACAPFVRRQLATHRGNFHSDLSLSSLSLPRACVINRCHRRKRSVRCCRRRHELQTLPSSELLACDSPPDPLSPSHLHHSARWSSQRQSLVVLASPLSSYRTSLQHFLFSGRHAATSRSRTRYRLVGSRALLFCCRCDPARRASGVARARSVPRRRHPSSTCHQ